MKNSLEKDWWVALKKADVFHFLSVPWLRVNWKPGLFPIKGLRFVVYAPWGANVLKERCVHDWRIVVCSFGLVKERFKLSDHRSGLVLFRIYWQQVRLLVDSSVVFSEESVPFLCEHGTCFCESVLHDRPSRIWTTAGSANSFSFFWVSSRVDLLSWSWQVDLPPLRVLMISIETTFTPLP